MEEVDASPATPYHERGRGEAWLLGAATLPAHVVGGNLTPGETLAARAGKGPSHSPLYSYDTPPPSSLGTSGLAVHSGNGALLSSMPRSGSKRGRGRRDRTWAARLRAPCSKTNVAGLILVLLWALAISNMTASWLQPDGLGEQHAPPGVPSQLWTRKVLRYLGVVYTVGEQGVESDDPRRELATRPSPEALAEGDPLAAATEEGLEELPYNLPTAPGGFLIFSPPPNGTRLDSPTPELRTGAAAGAASGVGGDRWWGRWVGPFDDVEEEVVGTGDMLRRKGQEAERCRGGSFGPLVSGRSIVVVLHEATLTGRRPQPQGGPRPAPQRRAAHQGQGGRELAGGGRRGPRRGRLGRVRLLDTSIPADVP